MGHEKIHQRVPLFQFNLSSSSATSNVVEKQVSAEGDEVRVNLTFRMPSHLDIQATSVPYTNVSFEIHHSIDFRIDYIHDGQYQHLSESTAISIPSASLILYSCYSAY